MSNNPPDKIVELTQDQFDFLLRNCNSNIAFGLNALQSAQGEMAVYLIALLESFKSVKEALERAK